MLFENLDRRKGRGREIYPRQYVTNARHFLVLLTDKTS